MYLKKVTLDESLIRTRHWLSVWRPGEIFWSWRPRSEPPERFPWSSCTCKRVSQFLNFPGDFSMSHPSVWQKQANFLETTAVELRISVTLWTQEFISASSPPITLPLRALIPSVVTGCLRPHLSASILRGSRGRRRRNIIIFESLLWFFLFLYETKSENR